MLRRGYLLLLFSLVACGDDGGASDDGGRGDGGSVDSGPAVVVLPDERELCANRDPLRQPFFGDLHVHTRFSYDAAGWGTRTGPEDAYRFARGEPVDLGVGSTLALRRPLDFAAVTDHAEYFAEISVCTDPESPGYDSSTCVSYREGDAAALDFGELSVAFVVTRPRRPALCRAEQELCADERSSVWGEIQEAAERFYDRTEACQFTTFVGWEWTGAGPGVTNIHRNVLFRGRSVPRVPVSYIEAPSAEALWQALDEGCNGTETPCEALAIPHNSNVGGGHMFNPVTEDGSPYTREVAEGRSRLEPLVEIYQHKGSSECISGLADPLASEDELCAFEQLHTPLCTGSPSDPEGCTISCNDTARPGGFLGACVSPQDFVRQALKTGLTEYRRVGANPFALGLIASSDSHNAASGHVEEDRWTGHMGDRDSDPVSRLRAKDPTVVGIRTNSPGGLAVLWAEDKSREALFDAMKRREAYGTSGTRIVVRFFGGFRYPDDLCAAPDLVAQGYAGGVPMGGELGAAPTGGEPSFIVSALRDPGTDDWQATPLQRVQIVKGWLEDGEAKEEVFDVAGDANNGADVDLTTCEPRGAGFDSLCAVWSDPDFDPTAPAFYYARVLENPTCRWSHRLCAQLTVDCDAVGADEPLSACCDGSLPPVIQERAWTSPIWYYPPQR